jgi:uncharacterized protein YfdQ (DUF2303 family)
MGESDAKAALEWVDGRLASTPFELEPDKRYAFVLPNQGEAGGVAGLKVVDTYNLDEWRARADVSATTAGGFVRAVSQRREDVDEGGVAMAASSVTPVLYADEDSQALVFILNDDWNGVPGWRDHRVALRLRKTPEWEHWRKYDDQLLDQEKFAEVIEDGLLEIVDPAAATMLSIAETFHATVGVKYKSQNVLSTGQRQLIYEEDIQASAGVGGEITMPQEMTLGVRPFFGSPSVQVQARLRFRMQTGNLTLGYTLIRPEDIERAAYTLVKEEIERDLSLDAIDASAPSPTQRPQPLA